MFKKYFGITLEGKITKKINDFFVLFLQFKKLYVSNDVKGIIQNNLTSDIDTSKSSECGKKYTIYKVTNLNVRICNRSFDWNNKLFL